MSDHHQGKSEAAMIREHRLAEALRRNLRRRKQQADSAEDSRGEETTTDAASTPAERR